jgi:hypothetical protein
MDVVVTLAAPGGALTPFTADLIAPHLDGLTSARSSGGLSLTAQYQSEAIRDGAGQIRRLRLNQIRQLSLTAPPGMPFFVAQARRGNLPEYLIVQVMPNSIAPTKTRRLAPTKSSNTHRAPHAARGFVPRGLSDA